MEDEFSFEEILKRNERAQIDQRVAPGRLVFHDSTRAFDGSNEPPRRELTARERDILCRVLDSIVYPFLSQHGGDPAMAERRAGLVKLVNIDLDAQVLDELRRILSPRRY